jgi:hypothetical protein
MQFAIGSHLCNDWLRNRQDFELQNLEEAEQEADCVLCFAVFVSAVKIGFQTSEGTLLIRL